jgi:hypothetical protein
VTATYGSPEGKESGRTSAARRPWLVNPLLFNARARILEKRL